MTAEGEGMVLMSAGWSGGASGFRQGFRVDLGGGWWCFEDLDDEDGGIVLVSPDGDLEMWFESVAAALQASSGVSQ